MILLLLKLFKDMYKYHILHNYNTRKTAVIKVTKTDKLKHRETSDSESWMIKASNYNEKTG